MDFILKFFELIRFKDIVDVALVAIMFYYVIKIIKGTRAEQLFKGILVILILTKISDLLRLYTIKWIFSNIMNFGFIAIFAFKIGVITFCNVFFIGIDLIFWLRFFSFIILLDKSIRS